MGSQHEGHMHRSEEGSEQRRKMEMYNNSEFSEQHNALWKLQSFIYEHSDRKGEHAEI